MRILTRREYFNFGQTSRAKSNKPLFFSKFPTTFPRLNALVEVGASSDLVTTISVNNFTSLLGMRAATSLIPVFSNFSDFTSLFSFNLALEDLARLPSFVFLLGVNPRLESPLINLRLAQL